MLCIGVESDVQFRCLFLARARTEFSEMFGVADATPECNGSFVVHGVDGGGRRGHFGGTRVGHAANARWR